LWAWPLLSEGAEELTIGVISTHTIFYSILFLIAAIFIDLGRISLLAIEQMIILLVVAGKDNSSFSASVEAVLYVTFLAALTGAAVLLRNRIISILSSGSAEAMVSARLRGTACGRRRADAASFSQRLKSQFVSNMSHELRTPLTAITGALELLARSHLAPAQIGHHAVASDATTQMLALVNNYLDYSKFEAGVVELASEGFSLRSTVRSAVQVRPTAEASASR
jgi:signal transduction histidine kinase